MKYTLFSALLSVGVLIGCSHVQDTKRIPASVKDVGVIGPDGEVLPNQKFPCGLKGSVDERIKDCSDQLTSEKAGFVLVTRSKDFIEVHKEVSTGLLWSDRLRSSMTHYNAEKACKADLIEVAGISGVTWGLPSIDEYKEAEKNGIRIALPNMTYRFWSSSLHRNYSYIAWLFDGDVGDTGYYPRDEGVYSVRCVAR